MSTEGNFRNGRKNTFNKILFIQWFWKLYQRNYFSEKSWLSIKPTDACTYICGYALNVLHQKVGRSCPRHFLVFTGFMNSCILACDLDKDFNFFLSFSIHAVVIN